MPDWQRVLAHIAGDVEAHFDTLKYRLGGRLGSPDPIIIIPYRGYGTPQKLYLHGRVIENEGITPAHDNDSIWTNLLNMYKRFESDEIPGARVLVRFQDAEYEVTTNEEGYFESWIEPEQPLPDDRVWHTVELELVAPQRKGYGPVRATGEMYVPLPGADFLVISDIDDTVIHTDAANLLRMARHVFLGNAHTRLPFPGVAAFYRALHAGKSGKATNPLFYVSSSPWNLYDLLNEFFELHNLPVSPVLLRDWGISDEQLLPTRHRSHKLQAIRNILELFPSWPVILIGDSGQQDPEIYHEIVQLYPDRILTIYIRNVSSDPRRIGAIHTLARDVVEVGSTLLLANDTYTTALHAAEHGWISPSRLSEIRSEKEADEAPPGPLERLLMGELE